MINDNDTLQNGQTFYDYHKHKMMNLPALNTTKGSNADRFFKFIDDGTFQSRKNIDELDLIHDIDYLHGLELDDKGDEIGIERGNLDDETYRFLIKAHILSSKSKGTIPDVKNIAAILLGCSKDDIKMQNARISRQNIINNGRKNTVSISDINIENVKHANLIPRLVGELNQSMAGGYHINQVGFYANIPTNINVGIQISVIKEISI